MIPTISEGSRFDWYEVTIDGVDDGRVPAALALALGARTSRGKGRNGYATCTIIERDNDALAHVYGGSSRDGEVHIVASSESCDELVPLIRRLWPDHRVSRLDSSIDFKTDWDRIDALALEYATARGLSHRLITDSEGGATRYLGAPSSELRVRVYRKSEQLRALMPERASEIPDGIVRIELQARPSKRDAKARAATMTADEAWGLGRWTKDFAEAFLSIDAPRTATHVRKPSDWSRSLHWLAVQYGPLVERRAAEVGREAAVAELLEALLPEQVGG